MKFRKRHGDSSLVDLSLSNLNVFERFRRVKTVGGRGLTHCACEGINISFSASGKDEVVDDNDEAGRGY